jgi:hypothetical protein
VHVRASAIGWRARDALVASGSEARVFAVLRESLYLVAGRGDLVAGRGDLVAGRELMWLGPERSPLHARAIRTADALTLDGGPRLCEGASVRIDLDGAAVWRPAMPPLSARDAAALVRGARALSGSIGTLGTPAGLAGLVCDGESTAGADVAAALLGRAAPHVDALRGACAADDAIGAAAAATALLGLGGGLTPSGDDLVGGALFARHLLAAAGVGDGPGWRRAAAAVVAEARVRTHVISATLLDDLAHGRGHAALHALAAAWLDDGSPGRAADAARDLIGIGHSSGWDVLAGCLLALVPR